MHALPAKHGQIGKRLDDDEEISVEIPHPADGLRRLRKAEAVFGLFRDGARQKRREKRLTAHRAGTRPAAAVRRGKGLMQGLVLSSPVADVVNGAMEKGLLVISAGSNVLRMVPPLIITREHVDEMIEILRGVLGK